MELILLSLTLAILVAGFALLWHAMQKRKPKDDSLLFLQNIQNNLQSQLSELNRTLDTKLGESSKVFREQFGQSANLIKEITKELTQVSEGHKQVLSITDQLKSLQDILKNPKQRGVLGEYYLENVLQNVLSPSGYQMQYPFKDGTIVDAVIFYQEKVIPIDSKFSLENYNRLLEARSDDEKKRANEAFRSDLKTRIDETAKYVKPDEDTIEFAFMFIPSEGIYYDLLVNKVGTVNARDLIEYAAEKKVVVVSPTSLLAYLQTVIQGLRQIEFNKSAEEIRKRVDDLRKHLTAYDSYFQKIGTHLGTTVNAYNNASKELKKIDKDVVKITGKGTDTETPLIEGPQEEEE